MKRRATIEATKAARAKGLTITPQGEIVGRAADGVEVQLGHIDTPESFLSYITTHPTPEHW